MIPLIFLIPINDKFKDGKKGEAISQPKRDIFDRETGKYKRQVPIGTKAEYESPQIKQMEFDRKINAPIAEAKENIEKKYELNLGKKVRAGIENIGKITRNAFDTTIGTVDAHYLNWQTKRYLKKEPESDRQVLYMMHGLQQTRGSQRRLARQARKQGYLPYLLKGNHSKGPEESAKLAFRQVENLHKKTGIKDAYLRNDKYTGHSSGGNTGLYMATDPDNDIKKYGIKEVHAVAPTPHGIGKKKTLGQRLFSLGMDLSSEDTTKEKGRETVKRLYDRGIPNADVYVTAGRYDNLVPPQDAVYMHAKGMHVIDHKDSTHFGTSGGNKRMNEIILNLISNPETYKPMKHYFKEVK